ncbi:MAG: hypothetical protein WCK05_16720, partial [Planctomycetota bacterium]
HVRLAADKVLNPTGYGCADSGTPVDLLVPDGADGFTGLFVRHADHNPGSEMKARGLTVIWDFSANSGITKDTKVEIRAVGMRMIYVPRGPFYVGSGGLELFGLYQYTDGKQDFVPYRVASSNGIPTGKKPGQLWARGGEPPDGGEIPATFPMGYGAFYCMSDPVAPCEYAIFLNTLPAAEAEKRFFDDPPLAEGKGYVSRQGEGTNVTYVGGYRAKSHGLWNMCWADAAAFAAWAGLRPMTELEFEKAMRGFREPTPREQGYSFWGMNFGGGVYNSHPRLLVVTVGNTNSVLTYKGSHGLGSTVLPADWPRDDAVGIMVRGGQGATGVEPSYFCTSDRHGVNMDAERRPGTGVRLVRTAPIEADGQPSGD